MKSISSTLVMKILIGAMIASGLSLTACSRGTLPAKSSGSANTEDKKDPNGDEDLVVQTPATNPTEAPTTAPNPDPTNTSAPAPEQTEVPSPLARYTKTQYALDLAAVKKIFDGEKLNLIIGYKNSDGSIQLENLESLAESKVATGTYPDLIAVNLELRLVAIVTEQLALNPTASKEMIQNAAKASLKASLDKLRAAAQALLISVDGAVAPEGMDPNVRASEIIRLKNLLSVASSKDLKDQIDLWNPTAPAPQPTQTTEPAPQPTQSTEPNPAPTQTTEPAPEPTQTTEPTPASAEEITAAQLAELLTQARTATTEFSRILLRKTSGDLTSTQYEDLKPLTAPQAQNFGSNKIQYEVSSLRLKAAFENAKKSGTAGSSEEQIVEAAQKAMKSMTGSAAKAYGELEKSIAGKSSKDVSQDQLKAEQIRAQSLKLVAESPDTIKAIESLK